MAANSALTLSSIDFDTLKLNFKEFLKTQSVFKDYDYDGSNMSVLLDIMSYNSYLNAFYLNMVASEMFLDSAQKYDSVVSHSKELNYTPRSTRSSVAEITLTFSTTNIDGKLTIPKGTRFTGYNSNTSFIFTTAETKVVSSPNSTFTVANLQIFDGDYFQDSHVVDYDIENQRLTISNKNIDTNSLTVNVVENNGSTNTVFSKAETLFNLTPQSNVYFLQPSLDESYEIVFGDNLFGRKPTNGAVVNLKYRVAQGDVADDCTGFVINDDIGPENGGQAKVESITTISKSVSGAPKEDIESIRFSAPRYFATQQRAVSSDDYSALVLDNFGGQVSDVVVYGGQEAEPKLYGRVIIAVKPTSGIIAPNYLKNQISEYMKEYIALPTRIVITDPDYIYCAILTQVQYDPNVTMKTASEIESIVLGSIVNFSKNNIEKFGNDLRYSRLTSEIDNSDISITSNDTDLRIVKKINPNFNQKTTYNIFLGNVLYFDSTAYSTNAMHKQLHDSEVSLRFTHATMISSTFTYIATNGIQYSLAFLEDDANGNISVFAPIGNDLQVIENVGTINYLTGEIAINDLNVSYYDGSYISLYFRSRYKDIFASQNKVITIDPNDVTISVIETQR